MQLHMLALESIQGRRVYECLCGGHQLYGPTLYDFRGRAMTRAIPELLAGISLAVVFIFTLVALGA